MFSSCEMPHLHFDAFGKQYYPKLFTCEAESEHRAEKVTTVSSSAFWNDTEFLMMDYIVCRLQMHRHMMTINN